MAKKTFIKNVNSRVAVSKNASAHDKSVGKELNSQIKTREEKEKPMYKKVGKLSVKKKGGTTNSKKK